LIFIGAFRFTTKTKQLLVIARLILVNYKPENRNLLLLQPVKDTHFRIRTFAFEDAFDEIELLSFPVSCTPFDLLQTKYRGTVLAKDLLNHHKRTVKNGVSYFEETRPTKRGTMYFEPGLMPKENSSTQLILLIAFRNILSGRRLLFVIGNVEVDYHFLLP
jgi:DNA polymerase-3 subunit alpha/error-prone DNA polymerase